MVAPGIVDGVATGFCDPPGSTVASMCLRSPPTGHGSPWPRTSPDGSSGGARSRPQRPTPAGPPLGSSPPHRRRGAEVAHPVHLDRPYRELGTRGGWMSCLLAVGARLLTGSPRRALTQVPPQRRWHAPLNPAGGRRAGARPTQRRITRPSPDLEAGSLPQHPRPVLGLRCSDIDPDAGSVTSDG